MPRPVFLATPERGHGPQAMTEGLLRELQVLTGGALKGSHIFVPHLQVGDVGIDADATTYFSRSLEALQEARVVVAVLDGAQVDERVGFFLGYAFAAEKPVIGYATDARAKDAVLTSALVDVVHDPRSLAQALGKVLL